MSDHACMQQMHSTSFITRRQGTSTKIRYVPYCETTLNIFTALREGVMAGWPTVYAALCNSPYATDKNHALSGKEPSWYADNSALRCAGKLVSASILLNCLIKLVPAFGYLAKSCFGCGTKYMETLEILCYGPCLSRRCDWWQRTSYENF